uniref:U3 small nucleolar RNA-associated protein 15 homolog n=1 Tax=Triatoma dimidiata TaxID=72491 RepID=A0A0V0G9H3_TRIDM
MSLFKKTNAKIFAKPSEKVTPDVIYWKQLGVPVLLKEFGPINYIDFSPVEPFHFAVTSSARVQIYNPVTKLVHKNLSKFKENAYGGTFRSDGQLLCAGGDEKLVKLFDVHSKSLLRVFKGHSSAVHRCYFTSDQTHITSFSDDKTVKIWDIPTETKITEFTDHEDYVRAGATSPVSPTTVISGSYDKTLKLYDSRISSSPVFTVNHGHPVESVLFLPSGGIFISAGGTELRVWDALAGGRLLARISHHHKTITCLCLASNNSRLLSGSLDRHVKIYDISTYRPVFNIDYPNSILSLGVSGNDETLVAGTVDGIVSVKRRDIEKVSKKEDKKIKNRSSYRYAGDKLNVDTVVQNEGKDLPLKHDYFLRKFQYGKVLDRILSPYLVNKAPHVTVALMQELMRRKGLEKALVLKQDKQLRSFLKFCLKYIGDYRFTITLIDAFNKFLDVFEDKLDQLSAEVLEILTMIQKRIQEEEELTMELVGVGGVIKMLLAASSVINEKSQAHVLPPVPSDAAQQNLISVSS